MWKYQPKMFIEQNMFQIEDSFTSCKTPTQASYQESKISQGKCCTKAWWRTQKELGWWYRIDNIQDYELKGIKGTQWVSQGDYWQHFTIKFKNYFNEILE